jgi:hypothetical protein
MMKRAIPIRSLKRLSKARQRRYGPALDTNWRGSAVSTWKIARKRPHVNRECQTTGAICRVALDHCRAACRAIMRESKLLHRWFALSHAKKYRSHFHFRFSKMSMRQTAQPEFDFECQTLIDYLTDLQSFLGLFTSILHMIPGSGDTSKSKLKVLKR